MQGFKFLNGDAAEDYLFSLSKAELSMLENRTVLKLWPGQFLFGCRRLSTGKPVAIQKFRVVDISADQQGALVKLIDMETGKLCNITHVPRLVGDCEVGAFIPQRMTLERTLRQLPDGKVSQGICTNVIFLTEEDGDFICCQNDFVKEGGEL